MKQTEKKTTREIVEVETIYVADDGAEFYSKEECEKYEKSCEFAFSKLLEGKLTKISVCSSEYKWSCIILANILQYGCGDDCTYYKFTPETNEDIKNFYGWASASNITIEDFPYENAITIEPNKKYIIVLGYDCDYMNICEEESITKNTIEKIHTAFKEPEECEPKYPKCKESK